jgi:hypothetical protein
MLSIRSMALRTVLALLESKFDKREGKNTRKAPTYRKNPLNVAPLPVKRIRTHKRCPSIGFLPLKAVPLIEV